MSPTKFQLSQKIFDKIYAHATEINRQARIDKQKRNQIAPEFNTDFIGALGEYIAAHYFGLEYCFNTKYDRNRSDLTNGFEVRSTTCATGHLITHDTDKIAWFVFAVVNIQEMSVDLKGHMHISECRQKKYWRDKPQVRLASYWTPQSDLRPMHELTSYVS